MNRILLLTVIAALGTGCRKPHPSPDYIEASNRYTDLLAVQSDAAYASPEMDAVVAQLGRVTDKSSDFAKAQELIATIAREKARAAAAAEANEKLLHPPAPPPVFPPSAPRPPPQPEAPPAVVEAKPAEKDPFAIEVGASWAPLHQKFYGCVTSHGPVTMTPSDAGDRRETEGWELVDNPDCRKQVPALAGRVALVDEGKIVTIVGRSALTPVTVPAPVPAPAPAAKVAAPPPAAPTAPAENPAVAPIKY
jgi:hypothetical protein